MKDAQELLYTVCDDFLKLSFILKLFQINYMDGMTNKVFTNMLQLFKSVLPQCYHLSLRNDENIA